jgi:hypothetical protein
MKKAVLNLLWIGILSALALPAFAETRTISWAPVTTYADGTPIEAGKTVTYSAFWTTDSGLGSLHGLGTSLATTSTTFDPDVQGMTRGGTVYFTAKAVLNTGEVSALSTAYSWVVPIVTPPPPPPPAVLISIAVSGPSSVNEGAAATYTASAAWSDGTNTTVTPTWSASLGTISGAGLFSAPSVTSNQSGTIGASYTYGGVTRTASLGVSVVDGSATLTGIAVSGPPSVNEGGTGTYTATGTWDNGTTSTIDPTWSENSSYATFASGGVLSASAVTSSQAVTVTATYGGRTATMSVTIVDVPAATPAAPKNMGIAGPTAIVPTETYRLSWDPVTTNLDGTPIDPGRTVRYTAYWTDDPALSPASLRQLESLVPGTVLDFAPSGKQMAKNQETYLTVRAILDSGDESPLAPPLRWVAANSGPKPPGGGTIRKKK